jgi:hypothetical protein
MEPMVALQPTPCGRPRRLHVRDACGDAAALSELLHEDSMPLSAMPRFRMIRAALLLPLLAPALAAQAPESTAPVTTTVLSTGDAIRASLAGAFGMMFTAIPRVLGFIIILLVGWLVASLVGKAVRAILHKLQFNALADRIGVGDFVRKMGSADPAALVAALLAWLIRIVVLLVAFDALGLTGVSELLRQLLLWIPNLVVAMVILVLAGIGARALGDLVRGAAAEAGFSNPETLANVTRTAVWVFAVIIAVNQVGIASNLINILVTGAVAALALAGGLAFGLGGRDLAARILENWYGNAKAPTRAPMTDRPTMPPRPMP